MPKVQQDVLIYKEKAFTTAQSQFEKDLKKRQLEGWRLVSVTPTEKKGFGRIVQLTAIYERDALDSSDITINVQHPIKAKEKPALTQKVENSVQEKVGMWKKIKESNRRATEKERAYQSTLNPEQRRKRERRNLLLGSITLLVVLALCTLCIGMTVAIVRSPDMQALVNADLTPQPTDTPTPTPTPIDLTTHQGVEAYARQILDNLSPVPYGDRVGIAYTESAKELQVLFYISSSQVWDNNNLKNMIEINCFDVQQALWTSRLRGIVGSITVHIQSDLVDKYGNQSKGEVGTATLTSATDNLIQWNNIDFDSAWNNQIYDEQWLLPSVENS